jgi:hypothetical protein
MAGEGVARVREDREREVVLLLRRKRPVGSLSTDGNKFDASPDQLRQQLRLIGPEGDVAVRTCQ